MATLWNIDPNELPLPAEGKSRVIRGGPLIDLEGLQECIANGQLDLTNDAQFWPATPKCQDDLAKNGWTPEKIAKMLTLLRPGLKRNGGDYLKSEWCDVEWDDTFPCDVYELPYDEEREQRNRNGLPVYLKFSLDMDGNLILVLVSAHPPST